MEEELYDARLGVDVGIWEGSIVFKVLYLVLSPKQLSIFWQDF